MGVRTAHTEEGAVLCHGAGLWSGRLFHSSNGARASCPGMPRTACLQNDAGGPFPFLQLYWPAPGHKRAGKRKGKKLYKRWHWLNHMVRAELRRSNGPSKSAYCAASTVHILVNSSAVGTLEVKCVSSPWLPLQSLFLPTHPWQRSPLNHECPVRTTSPCSSSSWPAVRYRSLLSSSRVAPKHNSISTCSVTPHCCCHYYRSWYCQEDGCY